MRFYEVLKISYPFIGFYFLLLPLLYRFIYILNESRQPHGRTAGHSPPRVLTGCRRVVASTGVWMGAAHRRPATRPRKQPGVTEGPAGPRRRPEHLTPPTQPGRRTRYHIGRRCCLGGGSCRTRSGPGSSPSPCSQSTRCPPRQ